MLLWLGVAVTLSVFGWGCYHAVNPTEANACTMSYMYPSYYPIDMEATHEGNRWTVQNSSGRGLWMSCSYALFLYREGGEQPRLDSLRGQPVGSPTSAEQR
jgi:hypothetical protein